MGNSDEHDHLVECDKVVENPAEKALDNDVNTVYAPTVEINNAEIVIDFNQTLTVTGLKYTAGDTTDGNEAIGEYKVYVLENGEWIDVAGGSFDGTTTKVTTTTTVPETTTTKATTSTTATVKHIASDEDLCNWSVNDYNGKNDAAAASAEITERSNGQYEITLTDDSGDVLDVYEIDPETGIGTDLNNNEVNLPQTGNSSLTNLLIVLGAFMMTVFGFVAVRASAVFRRKENE